MGYELRWEDEAVIPLERLYINAIKPGSFWGLEARYEDLERYSLASPTVARILHFAPGRVPAAPSSDIGN